MNQEQKIAAYHAITSSLDETFIRINEFCCEVMKTRGGRIGSGMGSLLEALWGYEMNKVLTDNGLNSCELAWFPGHQYHDFACVQTSRGWNPETGDGEFFRVEAKSMNSGADESKAHFDVLQAELDDYDALLLLVWSWVDIDEYHCCPQITDSFFGQAKPITQLRDALHLERGGSFVNGNACPDGCDIDDCSHKDEPLNEKSKRERLSGPQSTRPSANVSHSANFGGLVRMLKTRGESAKATFRELRRADSTIDAYISFIHKHFPSEEINHFSVSEWRRIGEQVGLNASGMSKEDIRNNVIENENYQQILRKI
jgi:hypothetical protein